MIFRAMKSHANEHTVCGRLILKVVSERVGLQGLREIHLRANILSEFTKNHVTPMQQSTGAINSSST